MTNLSYFSHFDYWHYMCLVFFLNIYFVYIILIHHSVSDPQWNSVNILYTLLELDTYTELTPPWPWRSGPPLFRDVPFGLHLCGDGFLLQQDTFTSRAFSRHCCTKLPCKVPTSTSGAVWGSISCPRTLRHADHGNWTSDLFIRRHWLYPWATG